MSVPFWRPATVKMSRKENIYSLDRLGLLNASSHKDLDAITSLARDALAASDTIITIVRPVYDRQYIVSHSGSEELPREYRELPMQYSICKAVRDCGKPVVYRDTSVESILADNPVIEKFPVGSYLGIPIHGRRGSTIGALACLEPHPRQWTEADIQTLTKFGKCVDSYIRVLMLIEEQKHANTELERLAQARADFLNHMSHELRTPLTGIIGVAKGFRSLEMTGRAAGLVDILDRTSSRLMEMLNGTLDMAKIDSGNVALEESECNIKELIEEIIALHKSNANQKGVDLICDYRISQEKFLADRRIFGSVLQNLVGNAVKFTEAGHVKIVVDPYQQSGLSIRVIDTGIGIAPEHQKAIFNEFEQAHSGISGRHGGTGIGLALVKRQVGLMGGDIEVRSSLGEGTTFRVLLDLKPCLGAKET